MKAYPEYQATEYDWLPSVPAHWQPIPMRAITRLSDERNGSRINSELLSVYREYGVIRKSSRDDNRNVESLDLSNYKYVYSGYLVMNKMKMWQGSLGISQYDGIVSPAYIVCKITSDINRKFLHILLRSALLKTFYNRISYGVRVGQWDMRYSDFKNLIIYIPEHNEQDQIVHYIDWKVSCINKLINVKKKQILLLEEKKESIIYRTVTKGLNETTPKKDSKINWIGSCPDTWKITCIGHVYNTILGKMLAPSATYEDDSLFEYVCAKDVHFDGVDLTALKKMYFSKSEIKVYSVAKGDLLVVEGGAGAGGAAIVTDEIDREIQRFRFDFLNHKTRKIGD